MIKLNIRLICILGLLVGGYLAYTASDSLAADPFLAFEMPIFQGGYDIKKNSDPAGRSKNPQLSGKNIVAGHGNNRIL